MGAPKQRWTSEEEAALKAGIAKYGPGKWSTILRDPEFTSILHSRSNVDLKDKWRNLSVLASGGGSRYRARPAKSISLQNPKLDAIPTTPMGLIEYDVKANIPKPPTISTGTLQKDNTKTPIPRLDNLILEAISNLKEPHGSSQATIAEYIEEKHPGPPNLEKLVAAELKALLNCGKLIKVKHQYRIPPSSPYVDVKKNLPPLLLDLKQEHSLREEKNTPKILTKAEIDTELEKMKSMTPQEAAAVAVKAVAEAEAAIAEAEKAAKEAEAAEADAELAQVFATAAMKALKQTALVTRLR